MKEQIITSKSKKELMKFFLDDTLKKALEESCGNKMMNKIYTELKEEGLGSNNILEREDKIC